MQTVITSNLSRLELHDSSFEAIVRHGKNIELTFDWAKLENLNEQKIDEPIVIGRTKMFLTEVQSEQFKVYDDNDNSKFSVRSLPDDLITSMEVIGANEIDDNSRTVKISGVYKESGKYNWAEWSFTFDTCKISWSSFVTKTQWLNGKLPSD